MDNEALNALTGYPKIINVEFAQEVAQGYKAVKERSAIVRFKVVGVRTCFRLEKGSDFSFSSGTTTKAPVDGAKLRYLVINRKPIARIGGCDYEVQ